MLTLDLGDDAELRALEPWNAAEFAAHVDRNREHLAPWLRWAEIIIDEDTAHEWLQTYADKRAQDAGRIYGIWSGDELVGGTLFRTFDAAWGNCEIGVWLSSQAQGQGLVTRSVQHMIDWAFDTRGMSRVEWHTDQHNLRSAAVAERLGMNLDGTLRSASLNGGVRNDVQIWSLIAGDKRAWHNG